MQKPLDISVLILYCGFIYWLSNQQTLPTPDLFENEDKLHHFLAYFVMGIIAWRAFSHCQFRRGILFLVSFIFCSAYGLSDEWHQSFVIGRNSNVVDWFADSMGGLLASVSCYWHSRKMHKAPIDSVPFNNR